MGVFEGSGGYLDGGRPVELSEFAEVATAGGAFTTTSNPFLEEGEKGVIIIRVHVQRDLLLSTLRS